MAEFPDLGKHCEYGGCNSLGNCSKLYMKC